MSSRVILGEVTGVFGVRGWIKLRSHTRPAEGLLDYPHWVIRERRWTVAEGRLHGHSLVARLEGLEGREAAAALMQAAIEVERSELPPAGPDRYYWADLIGCQVVNESGTVLGTVQSLVENGAQDVMVVRGDRERLIPFVAGPIVKSVRLEQRTIAVDWEPEY
ncbi:MAG: ribosome maturation factor RimM [Nevskiales bacterium]|nr:ribosome maturation factor RimM [Nevskiales bacterium]